MKTTAETKAIKDLIYEQLKGLTVKEAKDILHDIVYGDLPLLIVK